MWRVPVNTRERMQTKKVTGEQRRGLLIRGSFDETMEELKKIIDAEKPIKIIAVGDCVSNNMLQHKLFPDVLVVDNQIMREPITPIQMEVDQTLHVKNPPRTLTDETFTAMQKAIESDKRTRIQVDGEEDLITIVAVYSAPIGSFVIYGQPKEGIVVIRVTEERKARAHRTVNNMERVP